MLAVLADRTYRHLFTAQVIALTGTGLLTVALGLLAFQLAGGKAGTVLGTALSIDDRLRDRRARSRRLCGPAAPAGVPGRHGSGAGGDRAAAALCDRGLAGLRSR